MTGEIKENPNPDDPPKNEDSSEGGNNNPLEERRTKLQTMLEKSWRFYYRVAIKVWKKFSDSDRQAVFKAGRELLIVGAKYIHEIVDPKIPVGKKAAKNLGHKKESQKG